jgi:two-component system, NarL family, nitrate/nitrite response regulator NarL
MNKCVHQAALESAGKKLRELSQDRQEGAFLVTHEPAQQIEAPRPLFDAVFPRLVNEVSSHVCRPRAARSAMATLAIATRHEIAGAGIQALLQTAGHSVVARCSREDDLLRSLEAYRPDIIILAQNIVRQEGTETILRLRARNCSVRIIFMLKERDASTLKGLLGLQVEGILLSSACASRLIECVASVLQGRKWVDPELLRHLAIAEWAAG